MPAKSKQGFTLVELLLVITILGILASIIISILNPRLLIQRARDGVVRATIAKIAFAVEAYTSATGHIPSNAGCTCEVPHSCPLLEELTSGEDSPVACHKTQIVSQGTKLWMEVQSIKIGQDLLGTEIDLDDSDAIRWHDWAGGCLAAVSEANPPWVFVYHPDYGFMTCHPPTELHPGLYSCDRMQDDNWRRNNCENY